MVLLDNEAFLYELGKLFARSKSSGKGSVLVTFKKLGPVGKKNPQPPAVPSCLYRATLGSKKISTQVTAKDVNKFTLSYGNMLKANIDNLKKKDRKKKVKANND